MKVEFSNCSNIPKPFDSPEAAAQHLVGPEMLALFLSPECNEELTAEAQAAKTMLMVMAEAFQKAAGRTDMNHCRVESTPDIDILKNLSVHELIALRT